MSPWHPNLSCVCVTVTALHIYIVPGNHSPNIDISYQHEHWYKLPQNTLGFRNCFVNAFNQNIKRAQGRWSSSEYVILFPLPFFCVILKHNYFDPVVSLWFFWIINTTLKNTLYKKVWCCVMYSIIFHPSQNYNFYFIWNN